MPPLARRIRMYMASCLYVAAGSGSRQQSAVCVGAQPCRLPCAQGYLVVPGFLSKAEVARLNAAFDARWEERHRTLHEEEKDERLPDRYRMAAIRKMVTGDIKRHVDLHISNITSYDMLRSTIMNWAVDRKLERDRQDDPMDTSHAEWGPEDESSWSWDTSSPGDGDWEEHSHDSQ